MSSLQYSLKIIVHCKTFAELINLRTRKFVFLHLFHSHTKVNPKTLFLFCQMKTFNNHDASHCSVLQYKLTKDGARAATAMTSFVRLLPLCKKIIPGIECAICVEYCLGAPYRLLPGFLRWVARYFWSDDDTLFQFDVQKVVINGEA